MPLKLVPPRKGKTPFYSMRGTYLRVYTDRSTGARERKLALGSSRNESDRSNLVSLSCRVRRVSPGRQAPT